VLDGYYTQEQQEQQSEDPRKHVDNDDKGNNGNGNGEPAPAKSSTNGDVQHDIVALRKLLHDLHKTIDNPKGDSPPHAQNHKGSSARAERPPLNTARSVPPERSENDSLRTRGIFFPDPPGPNPNIYNVPVPDHLSGPIDDAISDFYDSYASNLFCHPDDYRIPTFSIDSIDDPTFGANLTIACSQQRTFYLMEYLYWIIMQI
jgi:hypothetical protein